LGLICIEWISPATSTTFEILFELYHRLALRLLKSKVIQLSTAIIFAEEKLTKKQKSESI
jgi:hypothetical protein